MYPKLNPIYKTAIDLRRCIGRLENMLNTQHLEELNPQELQDARDLLMTINEAFALIPKEYK